MLLKWLSRLKFDLYVAGSAIRKVAISSHKAEIDKMLVVWLLYFQSGQLVFNENCVLSTLSRLSRILIWATEVFTRSRPSLTKTKLSQFSSVWVRLW